MHARLHTASLDLAGSAGARFDGYCPFYAWRFS
jgi:hypothetical protein